MIGKKKLLVKRENHSCLKINNTQTYSMPTESVMNLTNNFSVAFWFKSTDFSPTANKYLVCRWDTAGGKRSWAFLLRQSFADIAFYPSATGGAGVIVADSLISSKALADGEWHHTCATYLDAVGRLYVDGAEDAVKTNMKFPIFDNPSTPLNCGNTVNKTQLQQLKYYNRVLSPEEVYTLYRQYPISRVGLVGEWDFNEKSGNVIYNTSQYGALLDGTTTGTREAVVW